MESEIIDIKQVYQDENGEICYEVEVLENGQEKNKVFKFNYFDFQLDLEIYYDDLIKKQKDLNIKLTKNENITFLFKLAGLASFFLIGALAYFWILGIIGWSFAVLSRVIMSLLGIDVLGVIFYGNVSSKFDRKSVVKELKKIKTKINNYYQFQEKCRTLILENKKQMAHDTTLEGNRIFGKTSIQEETHQLLPIQELKIRESSNSTSVKNLQVSVLGESLISKGNYSFLEHSNKRKVTGIDRPNFYNQMKSKIPTVSYPENSDIPEYLRKK